MPLKGIPPIISPDLLHALASMGHGDEILLADCHFPATSIAASSGTSKPILVRADGHGIPKLLEAILELITLDTYVPSPVTLMSRVADDELIGLPVPVWDIYKKIIVQNTQSLLSTTFLERFEFYERAKKAFVIVQTGESAQYGNIILKNGIVQHSKFQ